MAAASSGLDDKILSDGSYSGTLQNFVAIHPTIDGLQPDDSDGM
jgi:hypothetical protein